LSSRFSSRNNLKKEEIFFLIVMLSCKTRAGRVYYSLNFAVLRLQQFKKTDMQKEHLIMNKKTLALCCLLSLSACLPGAALTKQVDGWTAAGGWGTGVSTLDFAQTLDRKLVFVLSSDSQVHIYSADGGPAGTVTVGNRAAALAIEPRGKMLYIADQSGACTAVGISFEGGFFSSSVRKTWQLDGTPVDITLANNRLFVLEADSIVHIYSDEGARLGLIPAAPGTVAIDIAPPRGGLLRLVNQDGTCTAVSVLF
jgi:hypothetical protein